MSRCFGQVSAICNLACLAYLAAHLVPPFPLSLANESALLVGNPSLSQDEPVMRDLRRARPDCFIRNSSPLRVPLSNEEKRHMQMESAHSSTWLGIKWVPKEKKITQVTTARTASSLPFAHWSESHNKSHGLTGGRSWETSRVGMFPPSLAWGYSLRTLHRGSRARAPPSPQSQGRSSSTPHLGEDYERWRRQQGHQQAGHARATCMHLHAMHSCKPPQPISQENPRS